MGHRREQEWPGWGTGTHGRERGFIGTSSSLSLPRFCWRSPRSSTQMRWIVTFPRPTLLVSVATRFRGLKRNYRTAKRFRCTFQARHLQDQFTTHSGVPPAMDTSTPRPIPRQRATSRACANTPLSGPKAAACVTTRRSRSTRAVCIQHASAKVIRLARCARVATARIQSAPERRIRLVCSAIPLHSARTTDGCPIPDFISRWCRAPLAMRRRRRECWT